MSELHQRTYVNCPPHEAKRYIERYFDEERGDKADGDRAIRLAMRAPVSVPGLRTEIVLQRDVIATIEPRAATGQHLAEMSVEWEPAGGGPFPRFEGTLSARSDEGYESFALVLDGSYAPPLGAGGKAFDAALGHRIAMATARDLLARVCAGIERAFSASEHAKKLRREDELAALRRPAP